MISASGPDVNHGVALTGAPDFLGLELKHN